MYYICVQKCEWQERKDGRHALYLCYPRIFPPPILRFFFLILVIHRFLSCLRKRVFHRCVCGRGYREPSRRFCLVCAPSLPLHCKYIMPQTHCNCTECRSSSLFLFSSCYWRHKSCGGKKYCKISLFSSLLLSRNFFLCVSIVVRAFHFLGDAMLAFFFSLAKLLIIIIAPCTSRESPLRLFFFPSHIFHLCGRGQESLEPPQFIHAYGGRRALAWIALAL